VPGTGHRQKFGQTLDDAEDEGVEERYRVGHGMNAIAINKVCVKKIRAV
jgi:hypothetical protein